MAMHRFFVSPDARHGARIRFDDAQAQQMRRVLRLRPGDRVVALDGAGRQYEVELDEVGATAAGRVLAEAAAAGEPVARLTLYQSLLQRDKFEWVLQKGTEIGVAVFAPVITRRSLVRDAELGPERLARWRRIIQEAAEQSGRGALPALRPPLPFAAAAAEAAGYGRALIAWEGEARRTLGEALAAPPEPLTVALYVGPEGGFDPVEVEAATGHGALPVTFGPRILRTETAALVGAALVLYQLGELDAPRAGGP